MTDATPQIVPPSHENTGEATQERKRVALRVQSEPLWKYQSLEQFLKELISAIDGMHEDGRILVSDRFVIGISELAGRGLATQDINAETLVFKPDGNSSTREVCLVDLEPTGGSQTVDNRPAPPPHSVGGVHP